VDLIKLVKLRWGDAKEKIVIPCKISVQMSLPSSLKGMPDMTPTIHEIDKVLSTEFDSIDQLVEEILWKIYRHQKKFYEAKAKETLRFCAVNATCEPLVFHKKTPKTNSPTEEYISINAGYAIYNDERGKQKHEKILKITIHCITFCPCGQELVYYWFMDTQQKDLEHVLRSWGYNPDDGEVKAFLKALPRIRETLKPFSRIISNIVATHSQRAHITIGFRLESEGKIDVHLDVKKIVEVVEKVVQGTYGKLSREDELAVILNASGKAGFVEDIVRRVIKALCDAHVNGTMFIPPEALISVEVVSEETIHQHNIRAKIERKLGELLELLEPRVTQ